MDAVGTTGCDRADFSAFQFQLKNSSLRIGLPRNPRLRIVQLAVADQWSRLYGFGHIHRRIADEQRAEFLGLPENMQQRFDFRAVRPGDRHPPHLRAQQFRHGFNRSLNEVRINRRRSFRDAAVHVCRRFTDVDHRAARIAEFSEQLQGAFADRPHLRQQYRPVRRKVEFEHTAVHRRMARHQFLVAIIEIQIRPQQSVAGLNQGKVFGFGRLRRNAFHSENAPRRFDRVNHQQVTDFPSVRQRRAEPREIILHHRILPVPRRLPRNTGRVITLGLGRHRIPRQVLATQVQPQRILPVTEGFVSGKREIPSGTAVGFGQAPAAAELTRHGSALLGGVEHVPMFGQQVDAGRLHVFVETHGGADHPGLPEQSIFQQHMPGHQSIVPVAPFADLLRKRTDEQRGQEVVIIAPDPGEFPVVHDVEQFRQMGHDIIAVLVPEPHRNRPRPRQEFKRTGHVEIIRLVRENTGHDAPESGTDFTGVNLVGRFQEFLYGVFVHGIEIRLVVVPGGGTARLFEKRKNLLAVPQRLIRRSQAADAVQAVFPEDGGKHRIVGFPGCLTGGLQDLHRHHPHAVFLIGGNQSAGGAGGPAVFIVQPRQHPLFPGLIDAGADAVKPFRAEVFRSQPHP